MNKSIFKSKRVIAGLVFFSLLLISSFVVNYFELIPVVKPPIILDKTGKVIATTPYNPLQVFPFGTDRSGNNLLYSVLEGAKYTLSFVFGIACIQLLFGTILGGGLAYTRKSFHNFVQKVMQIYFFIPKIVWAIFILPIATMGEDVSLSVMIYRQFIILAIILTPPLVLNIAKEVQMILEKEFIICSKTLGGSKLFIFKKHIWVNIRQTLLLLFVQQCIQTLTFLVHLGFFHMAIGGVREVFDPILEQTFYYGNTNEWSSILSLNSQQIFTASWIPMAPMIMFMISIFVLNIMFLGMKSKMGESEHSVLY
ncbi:MAG: hypothetical protein K0R18_1621 [Bacillales bacterium]|jgi:peptide/nickel transport system permease protein|nr:hypothetical protein [Bacillales bacterium]